MLTEEEQVEFNELLPALELLEAVAELEKENVEPTYDEIKERYEKRKLR